MEENANSPVEEVPGEGKGESVDEKDGPPSDDCCPICFDDFTIPCKANCGHWYCANCILQFWNYSSASSKPCKCPMCSRYIKSLTPESSLSHQQEEDVTKVLKKVLRYNLLFVGGTHGLVRAYSNVDNFFMRPLLLHNILLRNWCLQEKVYKLLFFMKRIFMAMVDPDRDNLHEMRLVAMLLSVLYAATPFDFIPTGSLGIVRVFDYSAILLVFILRLIGFYHRPRLTQHVRRLADAATAQPADERTATLQDVQAPCHGV